MDQQSSSLENHQLELEQTTLIFRIVGARTKLIEKILFDFTQKKRNKQTKRKYKPQIGACFFLPWLLGKRGDNQQEEEKETHSNFFHSCNSKIQQLPTQPNTPILSFFCELKRRRIKEKKKKSKKQTRRESKTQRKTWRNPKDPTKNKKRTQKTKKWGVSNTEHEWSNMLERFGLCSINQPQQKTNQINEKEELKNIQRKKFLDHGAILFSKEIRIDCFPPKRSQCFMNSLKTRKTHRKNHSRSRPNLSQ